MFSLEIQVEQLERSENVRHLGTGIPTRLIYWHCKVTIRELLDHSKWATGALRRKNAGRERDTCGSCKVTMKSLHELEGKWDLCTWANHDHDHGNSRLKYPKKQTKKCVFANSVWSWKWLCIHFDFFFNLHTSLSEICIINLKVEDNKLGFYQSICTDNPSLFTPLQDRQKVHIRAS